MGKKEEREGKKKEKRVICEKQGKRKRKAENMRGQRKNANKYGGRYVYVRKVGGGAGGVDGWVSVGGLGGGGGVVLSIAACYHPPQPGRRFD